MQLSSFLLIVTSTFAASVSAQFGFFDQMFGGGGHQQQQQPQNVRSDSQWYQQQYEGGMSSPSRLYIHFVSTFRHLA
jgi:hypothetical protein